MQHPSRLIGRMCVVTIAAIGLAALTGSQAEAQQLVYQPSVSVGGFANPATFQAQLQAAQAQRPQDQNSFQQDPVQDFEASLQRSILSQLSRQIIESQFGVGGQGLNLQEQGTFQLGDFTVNVTPGIEGLQIRVANVVTGSESVVTVPSF